MRQIARHIPIFLNKNFVLTLLIQLLVTTICLSTAHAQSPLQKFDDCIMIDIQSTRTPAKTGFTLFMSNTHRYGDVGVPAAMLIGGIDGHNEALRQNSLYVASSTAVWYGLMALIKSMTKRRASVYSKY